VIPNAPKLHGASASRIPVTERSALAGPTLFRAGHTRSFMRIVSPPRGLLPRHRRILAVLAGFR
jgi:hypothetical protein